MPRFGPSSSLLLCVALVACGSAAPSGDDGGAGAGGADAGGAGAGGAAATGGAPGAPTCDAYCAQIQAACTGSHQQYGDADACKSSCAALPTGAGTDTSGDTLGCRVHFAALAAASAGAAALYCTKAGPGGDGTCGTNCDGYCDIVMTYCTAANNAQIYGDRAACMADCAAHGTTAAYTTGDPGRTDMGDEVACQLYHAVMGSQAPEEHCLGDLALTALTCRM
ncbi:MAG TPA: hypothetical protein VHL80_05710 [Polyangia bacterium]|nr:hypothetical protein [Polyangia bacterium]